MNAKEANAMNYLREENERLKAQVAELQKVAGSLPKDMNKYPCVIYFASEEAKDEFIDILKQAKPNLTVSSL